MKLLNNVTSVSVIGDNLSVAKADGSISTVNVPYAYKAQGLIPIKIDATNKTILEIKSLIGENAKQYNIKDTGVQLVVNLSGISMMDFVNSINNNDTTTLIKYTWNAGCTLFMNAVILNNVAYSNRHIWGNAILSAWYTNDIYIVKFQGNKWTSAELLVTTVNCKNVANTWKLSSNNELVIDANNTSTDQVVIGNTADNYTGSGFKYLFKDGKGNYADIAVHNVQGALSADGSHAWYNANNSSLNNCGITAFAITSTAKGGTGRSGNIIQSSWTQDNWDSQLFLPNENNLRLKFRVQQNSADWSGSSAWRELAYYDEVVTLTGTSTVTGTLNVPAQSSSDNSDKVASTAFVQAAIAAALKAKGL